MKSGYSIHCHHNVLWEYCYDYDGRVEVVERDKPQNEQEIRLQLFKLLPQEAIDELPEELVKADAEWQKAGAEWQKANAEWWKAYAEWQKAYAEWRKAYAEWRKAYAEWWEAGGAAWHKKWCGCSYWNGEEIIFDKELICSPHE
mgnify:CR=1 FL=1